MKRLALAAMVATAVVATAMLPALADPTPNRFRKGDSWCERHAQNMFELEVAGHAAVVVGGGTYLDRPVHSAYGCYDLQVGGQRRGDLVSAWLDGENGEAGVTCVKQSSPKSCQRTPVPLPFEASSPLAHPGEPWWLQVLGLEVQYGFADGVVSAGAGGTPCVPGADACVTVRDRRASAAPDIRYRARGYECAASNGSCTRTEAGDEAAVSEGGGPLLDFEEATVDTPGLCVELAVDPRC